MRLSRVDVCLCFFTLTSIGAALGFRLASPNVRYRFEDAMERPDLRGSSVVLFYSSTCPACADVRAETTERLPARLAGSYQEVETSNPWAANLRQELNAAYSVADSRSYAVPALFTEEECLVGKREIETFINNGNLQRLDGKALRSSAAASGNSPASGLAR